MELFTLSRSARRYHCRHDLLRDSVLAAPAGALVELGVGAGVTSRVIARHARGDFYGFDWFFGLPSDWDAGHPRGSLDCGGVAPDVPGMRLRVGLFQDTLPAFAALGLPVAFVHFDCDLYESARLGLALLGPLLVEGAVLNFNEFDHYEGAELHEARAFAEFLDRGWRCECIGAAAGPYSPAAFRVHANHQGGCT